MYPVTIIPTAILIGVSDVVGALAKVSIDDFDDVATHGFSVDTVIVTPFDILFNKIPLVDVNFFNTQGVSGTILQFRQAVAGWYYTMRLIASMVLLVILVYIGLRMALTSIATEKAIYKKMLVDWITSLALLFLLHYIILFVFAVNDALVGAMETIANGTGTYDTIMASLQLLMFHYDIVVRITAIVLFGMIVFQTISFLMAYIKRMFTIGFLIIIAPLITITYSMDKIGDGKAQALNTWLKEFIYNILLQPFQCILYLVFAKLAIDAMLNMGSSYSFFSESNVGTAIFAILSLHFVKEGEKIVKKIFGFDKASTAGDLAIGTALTAGAIMKGKDVAKKYGSSIMKGKNMIASSEAGKTMKKYFEDRKNNKDERKAKRLAQKYDEQSNEKGSKSNSNPTGNKTKKEKSKKKFTVSSKAMENARAKVEEDNKTRAERKENRKAKTEKILSKPKKFAGAVAKSSGQAIAGLYKYFEDNKKGIVGGLVGGMFTAGMGLASSDFGDFSKALAGYNMGKGFTEGIYENSTKELKKNLGSSVQMRSNFTNDPDPRNNIEAAVLASKNDIKKSIKEALKELTQSMIAHGISASNTNIAIGEFAKLAADEDTAGTLNKDWVSQKLTESGFQGTEEEKSKVIDKFSTYAELVADQSIANYVESAAAMGFDTEYLANVIGNVTPVTGNQSLETKVQEEEVVTREEVELPIEKISKIISKELSSNSNNGVNITNLEETNARIRELNSALERFRAADNSSKDEILSAIQASNNNIHTHEDLISSVEQQISSLQSSINQ